MKLIKALSFILVCANFIYGQEKTDELFCGKDAQIFADKISLAEKNNLSEKNINEIIETIGKSFTKYGRSKRS